MEVSLGAIPFDLDFHPSSPLVASGLINGDLHLYRYAARKHNQRVILTGSPDCSILATDVETGKTVARLENAHEEAINRLVNLTDTMIASGDDEGCIKVWDTRQHACCNSFDAHEDYVSDLTYVPDIVQILGTSGDGTLSVCSIKKNKVQSQSEFSEDELLSLAVMKNGKKVICGTQTGALLLYSWGHFKDCSDRFLGHPMSVDTVLKLDEDRLISGSYDGVIRLVGILPNKIIQPLAEHSEFPIERLAFSSDRQFIGSISHDQMLKLWDLEELLNTPQENNQEENEAVQADSDDDDDDEMDIDIAPPKSSGSKRKKSGNGGSSSISSFFDDL
ncbi:WD repeat-containing protein 55 [Rhynchospora pubera]|uniref:WD repeat-containing protein 55 n=1 Tax=Rhynchospora pubera TaxID=906938 RepID=A0AAV8GR80_9POAL|nr:WD repeat-containing protein 55 [Rhynchospora pubera]